MSIYKRYLLPESELTSEDKSIIKLQKHTETIQWLLSQYEINVEQILWTTDNMTAYNESLKWNIVFQCIINTKKKSEQILTVNSQKLENLAMEDMLK